MANITGPVAYSHGRRDNKVGKQVYLTHMPFMRGRRARRECVTSQWEVTTVIDWLALSCFMGPSGT